uniref:Aminotransferase-like plant mobile domain-containing protein n=1 Tax=Cajanus cajan TaxID=3821 RepID=A0A151RKW2_CAJCA|nr:hypothetical protein KK1_035392 [Cajanus cajan]
MAISTASVSTATLVASTASPTPFVPLLAENATISTSSEGTNPFVPIPGMEEASLKIFQSQVLLPFSLFDGSMHAFLGPYSNPSKKKTHNDLLPEDDSTLPFVYSPTIDLSLFSDTTKIFRAFPPPKDKHIQWLERVEASKQSDWKGAGIFDFVQLSKYDLNVFDPQILLSAIFFWNRETRAFEFPCGFVCLTLLDIAAITRLKSLGDHYLLDTLEKEIPMKDTSIVGDKKTYSAFVGAHHGKEGTPITDSEHIAFLLYWLSACVFCTPSPQVPKYYYTLA